METMQLVSERTYRVAAPQVEPANRWRLHRLFPWRRRRLSVAVEAGLCTPWLVQDSELHDAALAEARQRLEVIESDPDSDELTLGMARQEFFLHKRRIADQHADD